METTLGGFQLNHSHSRNRKLALMGEPPPLPGGRGETGMRPRRTDFGIPEGVDYEVIWDNDRAFALVMLSRQWRCQLFLDNGWGSTSFIGKAASFVDAVTQAAEDSPHPVPHGGLIQLRQKRSKLADVEQGEFDRKLYIGLGVLAVAILLLIFWQENQPSPAMRPPAKEYRDWHKQQGHDYWLDVED